jgi:pyruvate formate lyase activating enzyme
MAVIFDIKRFAIHDGPGIRATVFMKGCPLRCAWCHNPESMRSGCSNVPKTIQVGNQSFTESETVGHEITVEELMKELEKERIFMDESGGGVTFSGGEPMQQHRFLNEALTACQLSGMHTAVDTSGYASREQLAETAKHTDLFLYDLKLMDNETHQKYTGVSNKLILNNLENLLAAGVRVWIRIPLVPGFTFTDKNIAQTLEFLSGMAARPEVVNLLPYHNTASHKYERFGMENRLKGIPSLTKKELEGTKARFEAAGFRVRIGG